MARRRAFRWEVQELLAVSPALSEESWALQWVALASVEHRRSLEVRRRLQVQVLEVSLVRRLLVGAAEGIRKLRLQLPEVACREPLPQVQVPQVQELFQADGEQVQSQAGHAEATGASVSVRCQVLASAASLELGRCLALLGASGCRWARLRPLDRPCREPCLRHSPRALEQCQAVVCLSVVSVGASPRRKARLSSTSGSTRR